MYYSEIGSPLRRGARREKMTRRLGYAVTPRLNSFSFNRAGGDRMKIRTHREVTQPVPMNRDVPSWTFVKNGSRSFYFKKLIKYFFSKPQPHSGIKKRFHVVNLTPSPNRRMGTVCQVLNVDDSCTLSSIGEGRVR